MRDVLDIKAKLDDFDAKGVLRIVTMARHATLVAALFLAVLLRLAAPALADDAKPPLPMPDDASDVTFDGASGSLDFSSPKSVKDLAAYYRDFAKQQHWKEEPSVINKDTMSVLTFMVGDEEVATVTVMRMGEQSQVTIEGSALKTKAAAGDQASSDKASADNAPAADVAPPADVAPLVAIERHGLPMPDGMSSSINEFNDNIKLSFIAPNSVADIVAFYRTELTKKGWKETAAKVSDHEAELTFSTPKSPARLTVKRNGADSEAELGVGPDAGKAEAAAGSTALVAIEKNGLPLPRGLGNNGSSATQFSKSVNFSAPNSVAEIVAFYRAELSKKGWKEDAAKVDDDGAELSFTAPEGPAKLTVKHNNDMSDAELTLTLKAKAASSPLAPKPGMVKLVFGNLTDKPADVTIAGKHVKLAPQQGSQGPDGPTLEVKPGALEAVMKGAKAPFTAGPDEIWMVGVGPGGLIAIKQ